MENLILTQQEQGGSFVIGITASGYDGATITATHVKSGSQYSTGLTNGKGVIEVAKAGEYTITNDLNEETKTVKFNQEDIELQPPFQATITVTLSEELLGYTVELEDVESKKATSTVVSFTVKKQGNYTVKIKGNDYLSRQVEVEEERDYPVSLTLSTSDSQTKVPIIIASTKSEDNDKIFECTKGSTTLTATVKNGKSIFILPETGIWTVQSADYPDINKTVNVEEVKTYKVTYRASVYTVAIKKAESNPYDRVEYRDDAEGMTPVTVKSDGTVDYGDWKDTFIFEKIYPVMLKTDGTEDYRLDPDDQTRKLDGSTSDIANTEYDGNAMVRIGKFYTKFSEDSDYEYISICEDYMSGYDAIGFKKDETNEVDQVYLGMFLASITQTSTIRSIANRAIYSSNTQIDANKFNYKGLTGMLGNGYNILPFSLRQALVSLALIMIKSDDVAAVLGTGRKGCNINTLTNWLSLNTGLSSNSGSISKDSGTGCIKFLWIEDFVSDDEMPILETLDGLLYVQTANNQAHYWVKMTPPYHPSHVSIPTTGYADSGLINQGGYIVTSLCNNSYGRIPQSFTGGSSTTYQADKVTVGQYIPNLNGGSVSGATAGGLWGLAQFAFASMSGGTPIVRPAVTARLSYIPQD